MCDRFSKGVSYKIHCRSLSVKCLSFLLGFQSRISRIILALFLFLLGSIFSFGCLCVRKIFPHMWARGTRSVCEILACIFGYWLFWKSLGQWTHLWVTADVKAGSALSDPSKSDIPSFLPGMASCLDGPMLTGSWRLPQRLLSHSRPGRYLCVGFFPGVRRE